MPLPDAFVWTRFGAEAGQSIEDIIARKERERQQNGGVFLWGIGNSIGPSLPSLLRSQSMPMVAFSPMKSKPRAVDVEPGQIAIWCRATTTIGEHYSLPAGSMVTSRYVPGRNKHFALVCRSDRPLSIETGYEALDINGLVNAKSGTKVGFSQVTAVVEKRKEPSTVERKYSVAMCCQLEHPFVITLQEPEILPASDGVELDGEFLLEKARSVRKRTVVQMPLALI